MTSSLTTWSAAQLARLEQAGGHLRTWGDAYGYALVASGRVDAMVDPVAELWDLAPMPVILSEAGGRFSALDGSAGPAGGAASPAVVVHCTTSSWPCSPAEPGVQVSRDRSAGQADGEWSEALQPGAPAGGVADGRCVARLASGDPPRLGREGGHTGLRRVLGLDALAQHLQRLGAQLGDPRLRDAQLMGELLGRAVLQEVADDDEPVALGEQPDGVLHVGQQLPQLELLGRLEGPAVVQHVHQQELVAGHPGDLVVQRQDHRAEHAVLQAASSWALIPSAAAISVVEGTRPSSVARRCSTSSRRRARLRTERGAQSAARTASRIAPRMRWATKRSNGTPPRLVEAARRLHEAQRAGAGELLAIDMAGIVERDLEDDVADEREVTFDPAGQRVLALLAECLIVAAPADRSVVSRRRRASATLHDPPSPAIAEPNRAVPPTPLEGPGHSPEEAASALRPCTRRCATYDICALRQAHVAAGESILPNTCRIARRPQVRVRIVGRQATPSKVTSRTSARSRAARNGTGSGGSASAVTPGS